MRTTAWCLALTLLAGASSTGLPGAAGAADALGAEEIMRRVEASPRGRDLSAKAVWRLIPSGGRERTRQTRFYRLEKASDDDVRAKWLLVFDAPPDVKDTALLVWNPRDPAADPEQWIYLAGYRKVRRIAAGTRGNAFMGSDFSFEDLTERLAADDAHALLRQEELASVAHYVVESTPREPNSAYGKRIQWINPEGWTPSQIQFFDRDGRLSKTLRMRWARVESAWVTLEFEMTSERSGHRTQIAVDDVEVDQGLDDSRFEADRMARGGS